MRPWHGVAGLLAVSAARRVIIHVVYCGIGKFDQSISCCPFNGQCPLFELSAYGGFTVFLLLLLHLYTCCICQGTEVTCKPSIIL